MDRPDEDERPMLTGRWVQRPSGNSTTNAIRRVGRADWVALVYAEGSWEVVSGPDDGEVIARGTGGREACEAWLKSDEGRKWYRWPDEDERPILSDWRKTGDGEWARQRDDVGTGPVWIRRVPHGYQW